MTSPASDAQPIRVLLAHDNPSLRADLRRLIDRQGDMQLVDELADGDGLVERAGALAPDVVLVDLTMPGCGLRALERLARSTPAPRVVVLVLDDANLRPLRSVLAFGGLGYVVHALAHAELVSVIRKVKAGRSYVEVPTGGLPPDALALAGERAEQLATLSKREREVLEAVAYGYTNREVAEWLGVSVKSIETYRYRVAEKLGFKSRADLVRFALATGLLDVGRDPLARAQVAT